MFAQCLVSMLSSSCHRPWPWFICEDAQSASVSSILPNAFEVLIASQNTVDKATLPLKIQERNKDKLFNYLVSFFESKGWDS